MTTPKRKTAFQKFEQVANTKFVQRQNGYLVVFVRTVDFVI